ncbi:HIT family protein [Alginatibacterium sediminis]|uniref:HIT family protein n=1 Tax=Alginatibacterium sediminis TaxID=2164068 RepID=A0A420EN97_9ALTE|nr:HIT family protein [Alginatibacterium sediminis]RKF22205.1 HIT family protein [Alginatibacterium sediminis]
MSDFKLHPRLEKDCYVLGDFPLCQVLMMDDHQYPWFILVPKREETELYQLHSCDLSQFWRESKWLSQALVDVFSPDKLNVASLGNVVPQLHVHHIARYETDPVWPAPIWGQRPSLDYPMAEAEARLDLIRDKLSERLESVPSNSELEL